MEKIIYASQYGNTKAYAEKLAELTGIPACSYEAAGDLSQCEKIIYMGGLYAGSVTGLKQTAAGMAESTDLTVITVGLSDPGKPETLQNIKKRLARQVPPALLAKAKVFHLRGGIDYSKLSKKHHMMMSALVHVLKLKPAAKRGRDERLMIDTYNKKADLVNLDSLAPIAEALS